MVQIFTKVVLQRSDGMVLVLRRAANDYRRPGEWDLPGGGVEAGESPQQGIARELYEEAGITLPHEAFALVYAATEFYEPTGDSNTRVLFLASLPANHVATVALSHEHDEFKWQPVVDALNEHPHPAYKAGLQYLVDHKLIV